MSKIRRFRVRRPNPNFSLSLEENALDSLVHATEHFVASGPRDLKYAITHMFHAVELYLKARLAIEHPLLIRERPEQTGDDFKTANFDVLIARLRNAGVQLSKVDEVELNSLRAFRNRIEHYQITVERSKAVDCVGKAARFLESFLENELEITMQDVLDQSIYSPLSEAIHTYQERLDRAKRSMRDVCPRRKDGGDWSEEVCDNCGEETVLVPDPTREDGLVHCFFCEEQYFAESCARCGSIVLLSSKPDDTEFCQNCWIDVASD